MSRRPPVSEAVEAVMGWLPLAARAMDAAVLVAVQPEVQACLRLVAPSGRARAQDLLRAMYLYLPWVLHNRGTLARSVVWHPHTVAAYLDDIKDERSVEWRQNHRIFLKRIGQRVNPTGWPRKAPLARSPFAEPYSADMEGALCLAGELRCVQHGGAAEIFALVASLGAGMAGTEIPGIGPGHVINLTADRLAIEVSGEFGRVAPIRAPYTRLAQLALDAAAGRPFIPKPANPKTSDNAVYRAAERVAVKNAGHLSFPRARNTWLLAHLRAGTELRYLERISRPVKADTLTALLKTAARDIDPMEAALRGLKA